MLNKLKSFGGFLFCIACIISWVVLLAPNFIIGLGLQPSAIWEHGAFISVFGFSIFFVAWVISKARSRYGYKYWDWKSLKIAKIMGAFFTLSVILWIISLIFLKTEPVISLSTAGGPTFWILGFLTAFVSLGVYMRGIRAGKTRQRPLIVKIKDIVVPVLIFLVVAGGGIWLASSFLPGPQTGSDHRELEQDVFELINQKRANHGLDPVEWDNQIAEVARSHSRDMVENDFYSHTNLQGEGVESRLLKGGVNYSGAGEVILKQSGLHGTVWFILPIPISKGQDTMAQDTIEGWMNSWGHREIILTASFKRVGVGVGNDGNTYYFTTDFV